MKRTTTIKWGNLRVGIVLIFATAIVFWASFSGGGTSIFQPKAKFKAYFNNVNGLVSGSPVWMSGVEVGNVKSVKFVNLDSLRRVEVICRVKKSSWHMLAEDSEVMLGSIGLVGDKYVEIIPGTKGKPVIEEMDVIATRDAGDAQAMFKAGEEALLGAGDLADKLDELLARMNRGEGTLGQLATNEALYKKITALVAKLTKLTSSLQDNQERVVLSIEKTANTVEDLSAQVSENRGTLGKIMNDPALYDNLAATSASLDSILFKINATEGNLGLLVNDTAMYTEFTNLLVRVNNLVTDMQRDPHKYFKFSLF